MTAERDIAYTFRYKINKHSQKLPPSDEIQPNICRMSRCQKQVFWDKEKEQIII